MFEHLTETLQESALLSIVVSAVVVVMIAASILNIYAKAREEKES